MARCPYNVKKLPYESEYSRKLLLIFEMIKFNQNLIMKSNQNLIMNPCLMS